MVFNTVLALIGAVWAGTRTEATFSFLRFIGVFFALLFGLGIILVPTVYILFGG